MKRTRISELAELIDKRGKLTLTQIQDYFPTVSLMTLRRDLLALEQDGRVLRVRGVAMSTKEVQKTSGVPYTKKTAMHSDEKICIAKKVATLVEEGVSLFLDAGTTALYLAKELPDIPCNIFTNGLAVATELSKKQHININHLGGPLIKENLSTASSLASAYFNDSNFEFAIIGASAFTSDIGFACGSQTEADLLKLICKRAKFTYIMLDSSKIGKIKPYTFAHIEDISVLITDDAFPEGLKELFKEKNIVVI